MRASLVKSALLAMVATLSLGSANPGEIMPLGQDFVRVFNPSMISAAIKKENSLDELAEKYVKFKRVSHDTGDKRIEYLVAKIDHDDLRSGAVSLEGIFKSGKKIDTDDVQDECLAAVNGSFYDEKGVLGYFRNGTGTHGQRGMHKKNKGYLVVKDGVAGVKRKVSREAPYDLVLESFPLLIYGGKSWVKKNKGKADVRTAIGLDKENNVYLIGNDNSVFFNDVPNFAEFVDFLQSQKLEYALNLDGGTAAHFYVRGKIKQNGYHNTKSFVCVKPN